MIGSRLRSLFSRGLKADFFDEIEDLLIEADLGPALAIEIRKLLELKKPANETEASLLLKDLLRPYLKEADLTPDPDRLNFFLFLGVNGVGKTTSISKIARYYKDHYGINRITAAAADTFRAAASEQLSIHGERQGFRVVKSAQGADPGAVIYDAISSALSREEQLVLADTAGRMHNKAELVNELKKIDKIISARIDAKHYKRLIVIDSTTGQNGLRQAEVFNEALALSGVVLSKYDSTAKGGSIAAIGRKLNLPIYFVGTGEGLEDIRPFNTEHYLDDLLS